MGTGKSRLCCQEALEIALDKSYPIKLNQAIITKDSMQI